jgi:hypothetical protein
MSIKISAERLAQLKTITEFLAAHPKITENQLRWALRHRETNGLKPYVFTRVNFRPLTLLLDPVPVARWFGVVVRA